MSETKFVTQGKPKIGGAISVAPAGATLPTNATSPLSDVFKSLGYISSDGLTNSNSMETSDITAWGGDKVLNTNTSKTDTFKFSLMESMNVDVLKLIYGADNVSGDLENGITIKSNSKEQDECVLVVDMIFKGEYLKRIVVPNAKVTAVDDIVYKDDQAVVIPTTISATADADGNTHYEYIGKKVANGN